MDPTDARILNLLMRDGRATWADLAVDLDLTAPAIAQRVKRLQDRGIIRQFAALLAADTLVPISAFVTVSVDSAQAHATFRQAIQLLDVVQECHQLTGDADYLLKVRCDSLAQLGELTTTTLPQVAGGVRARSSVVLSTVKESAFLPLPNHTQPEGARP